MIRYVLATVDGSKETMILLNAVDVFMRAKVLPSNIGVKTYQIVVEASKKRDEMEDGNKVDILFLSSKRLNQASQNLVYNLSAGFVAGWLARS